MMDLNYSKVLIKLIIFKKYRGNKAKKCFLPLFTLYFIFFIKKITAHLTTIQ